MIALGLLLALFTFLPSAQDSAEGLPSVQPVDYVSLMDSHSYDYLSHGNHQCDMYSDSRDAAIEEAKVYCSSHSDCGGFAISQFWESFCPQFFSLNPTTYDNSAWTFFVKSEEVVTSMEAVQFMTSDSGDNCDNACEAIGEECIEDMLFLQSAEEVASWALEVGVACREILDRCDIGESPIFLEDGVCTFCSNPNHPGWDNGNRCGAQWHIRQRICPCTSTLAESKSTVTPEGSTTELPDAGFTFRLRGDMGTESVTINDGGLSETIVLSQEWTEFVAFSSTIAIEFTNDDGFDRENIDFESNFETNIIAQQQWSNWDCDSDNENLRCQIVRNGRFAWYATYLITFGEEITDYGFVQGGLCGENWTDMMRGAIELSRNNEEPAKDPMECAKLTAENSECGSYFVQRNDYHVCWCMSKQGVHADCSIRDDWQIHSSGNSYGSIYKLVVFDAPKTTSQGDFIYLGVGTCVDENGDYPDHLGSYQEMDEGPCRQNCIELGEDCLGYGIVSRYPACYLWVTSSEISHPGFWASTSTPAWSDDHEITDVNPGWQDMCYKKVKRDDSQRDTTTLPDPETTAVEDCDLCVSDFLSSDLCHCFWDVCDDILIPTSCADFCVEDVREACGAPEESSMEDNCYDDDCFATNAAAGTGACTGEPWQHVAESGAGWGWTCAEIASRGWCNLQGRKQACPVSCNYCHGTDRDDYWKPQPDEEEGEEDKEEENDPVVTSVYKKTDCRFDYSSTARSAGDYGAHLNTPKTLEECEALCDANPECASFVVDQMGGGKCHLRTECPLVNEDCIEASSWGFINYVKEDCEASSPTSLPDDLPSTMNWTAHVMEYGTNECALGTTEITNENDCRAAQQQLGLDWNEVVNCNWCPGGCYTSSGWVNWNTHSGAARVHDAPICRSTETSEPSNIPSLSPITSNPSMHPSIVPSSTPSALPTNRPSVAPTIECAEGYELKQGDPMYGRGCRSEGISCIRRISAEECAAICSDSKHCVAFRYSQYHKKCVTIDTSVYYSFNVHIRGFHQGEGTYCEKAHTTMRPFEPEAKFTTSEPGQSCKEACESIEEECRADMLFLQSAEEVTSWALAANVTCTSIVEKCSWAVAPLFHRSHPEFTNNEVVCTFCSEPEPEWKYGAVCNARFGSDTRICPCSSTWSSAPTKTPTSSPTDLPTIQPSVSPTFSQPTAFPSMSPTLAGYEGSMCNVDDDCDSERCNFGEFPPRCRQKETHSSECNRDGDCESDLCLGRKCVDGRDNDRCNSNDDCQSGRCAYGIPFGNCQAPAEHGENCIRNNDCASQHCLLSTCTDHRDGAHCANDDDCLEGSSCVWSKTGATCKKNHGCTWWNWNECSEKCTWFQKVTFTCY